MKAVATKNGPGQEKPAGWEQRERFGVTVAVRSRDKKYADRIELPD